MRLPLHTWIFSVLLVPVLSNELSRCCGGGARHFHQTSTCSNIKSEGTSLTCVRSASICCIRALLDKSCDEGASLARAEETCPSNINELGGGLRKECCDCCLLAKDLVRQNEACIAPTGFSAACLKAFTKCCTGPFEFTGGHEIITGKPLLDDAILRLGDRCSTAKCDHLCNDRGGDSVDCSCRAGFDLGPDGTSCIDVDECLLLVDDCLESQRCLNTPGSFKCIRTLSCGTGYAMDSDTEQCMDVDECNLGSHDCGALYQCRNTQGSYRCDPKKCGEGELQNPLTGECTSIDCPIGYFPKNGMCNDVDECTDADRCGPAEECLNTPGSFRCQQKGNVCAVGYSINQNTGFCDDIDECRQSICGHLQCINLPGGYKCKCPPGYDFNEKHKRCEDIDECAKFAGHVCDLSAECHNTIGSFVCTCKPGFKIAEDGRRCEDVDECVSGIAHCEQKCINIPGSYQCICERGFALGPNGKTCEDIDECSVWAGSGSDLCMGGCKNTRGSYTCDCPPGYEIQGDGRTCVDIDECSKGLCKGSNRVCVNTLGSHKCHRIECPKNYEYDNNHKNKCLRTQAACDGLTERVCRATHPVHIFWQYIAIPKSAIISTHRPSITLFSIKGPPSRDSRVQFELLLKEVTTESPRVLPAVRANFLLQAGNQPNSAIVSVRDSLDGPQDVQLELVLRLTKKDEFVGKYVANLIVHVAAYKKHSNIFLNTGGG